MSQTAPTSLRRHTEVIIFGTTTPAGRAFDIGLLLAIVASVTVVMLDSVASIHAQHGDVLRRLELIFTALFTVEYVLRLWSTQRRLAYVRSYWGIIDLLSILPTYIALLVPEAAPLLVVRLLRIMRVFRVFELFELLQEFREILKVLSTTSRAILVFGTLVAVLVVVFGSLLYVVEGPEHGFTSIPLSMYWAIVTITTVGYGDITPQTGLGKAISSLGMLIGYSIIAVPTAIITTKLYERLNRRTREHLLNWNCPVCARDGHTPDAEYCKHCGSELDVPDSVRADALAQDPPLHDRRSSS